MYTNGNFKLCQPLKIAFAWSANKYTKCCNFKDRYEMERKKTGFDDESLRGLPQALQAIFSLHFRTNFEKTFG